MVIFLQVQSIERSAIRGSQCCAPALPGTQEELPGDSGITDWPEEL